MYLRHYKVLLERGGRQDLVQRQGLRLQRRLPQRTQQRPAQESTARVGARRARHCRLQPPHELHQGAAIRSVGHARHY